MRTRTTWKVSGIYEIAGPTGSYVGASINIGGRWTHHRCQLRKGEHPNGRLQAAWDHYGEDSFTWRILERCDEGRLPERERFYLQPDSLNYWTHPTGRGSKKSPLTRWKMSQAAKQVASDPEERKRRSERAKAQWVKGNIGRKP